MADLTKRQAREIDRDRFFADLAEQSYARQYFQYARYKTREHDKVELIAGLIVGLVFALIFGSGSWPSTLGIGLLAFGATLLTIFLLHWIRAPSAFHQRAMVELEKGKALTSAAANTKRQRRQMIAERLAQLIKEAPPVTPAGLAVQGPFEGLAEIARIRAHRTQAINFLEVHCGPEAVAQFENRGTRGLEELLADALQDEEEPTRPVIKGEIEEVIESKSLPGDHPGFDYYLILRFWLRNSGTTTNFQKFSLTLHIGSRTFPGELLSLSGYCLDRKEQRQTGAYTGLEAVQVRLEDYDALTPLAQHHSRPGWLSFVVRNVVSQETAEENHISQVELIVTDGSGKPWPLVATPPWEEVGPNLRIEKCPGVWSRLGAH